MCEGRECEGWVREGWERGGQEVERQVKGVDGVTPAPGHTREESLTYRQLCATGTARFIHSNDLSPIKANHPPTTPFRPCSSCFFSHDHHELKYVLSRHVVLRANTDHRSTTHLWGGEV